MRAGAAAHVHGKPLPDQVAMLRSRCMQSEMYYYEPAQGHGLPHDPFNAIVGPRPIGWISSHDAEGRLNLAPYSFFNAFNYTPPIIGFSSVGRKDSLNNIEATGEFCRSEERRVGKECGA